MALSADRPPMSADERFSVREFAFADAEGAFAAARTGADLVKALIIV